jgi:hypothetical protein
MALLGMDWQMRCDCINRQFYYLISGESAASVIKTGPVSGISALHIECVVMLQNKLKQSDLSVRTERASCHELFSVGMFVVGSVVVVMVVGLCELQLAFSVSYNPDLSF